jgi:hypothetical protein
MNRLWIAGLLFALGPIRVAPAAGEAPRALAYRPAPVDNPLKGLVPYQGDRRGVFPHSLEFNYLPYSALVKDYDAFDWEPLERMLDDIAARGHQAVLRVYLEYPQKKGAIPEFLLRDGLKVHRSADEETPDYEDKNLRRSLESFISAFGKKYDGDPRLGFLTAGLLGAWGEWHTFPRSELFASQAVQLEVMAAYEAAFKVTPVLLRYPAGANDHRLARNADRKFGYHDDSFAWATLPTGRKGDEWFYMTALKAAGPDAEARWKTHPIGGEIRPEAWGRVFDAKPGNEPIQDFRECVEATHVTWLMDSGMFAKDQPVDRIARAKEEVRRMGYEFYVPEVTIGRANGGRVEVKLKIENHGVAPFYYDWKAEYGLLAQGNPVKTMAGSGTLTCLLPGDAPRVWVDTLDVTGVGPGTYLVAVRVPNPLKAGPPLRFANQDQDAAAAGWLSLGEMELQAD